jgi:hypothetical protein
VSERERLPDRRFHSPIDFKVLDIELTAGVGFYPDGRVAELFLDTQLTGSALDTLISEIAIAFSFAVQHGASTEAVRHALPRDGQGQAIGPLGTILDLLANGAAP